jgi:bacterial/archaeal transporter family-2 protein
MLQTILTYLIGMLGGAAVAAQSTMVGIMGQRVGGLASSLIVHLSGAVIAGVLLALRGGENIHQWRTLPWYMLISGVFGVVLYLTFNYTFPRLGGGAAIMLIIVGQLVMGVIVDHFGLLGAPVRPVELTRVLGIGVLLIGGYLIVR